MKLTDLHTEYLNKIKPAEEAALQYFKTKIHTDGIWWIESNEIISAGDKSLLVLEGVNRFCGGNEHFTISVEADYLDKLWEDTSLYEAFGDGSVYAIGIQKILFKKFCDEFDRKKEADALAKAEAYERQKEEWAKQAEERDRLNYQRLKAKYEVNDGQTQAT